MIRRVSLAPPAAALALVLLGTQVPEAAGRTTVLLDGDPSVRALDSEDVLLTQVDPARPTVEFGSAVAFGRLDGDAAADAVVGHRGDDRVYVYFDPADPNSGAWFADPNAADVVIVGTGQGLDQFGFSIAAASLDADLYDDLIVGAPFSDGAGLTDAGRAFVILTGGAPLPRQTIMLDDPPSPVRVLTLTRGADARSGDLLGFAVGAVRLGAPFGTALAVSARGAGGALPGAGAVHVVPGAVIAASASPVDLTAVALVSIAGAGASDAFGEALASCDVDGGGREDLIVGAIFGDGPSDAGSNRGEVLVFLGENIAAGHLAGQQDASAADLTIWGATNGDDLGYSVACGNLDADAGGRADLIAGAIFADGPAEARPTAGEVYVLRGPPSEPVPGDPTRRRLLDPDTLQPRDTVDLASSTVPGDPAPDEADLALLGATTADQLGFAVAAGDVNRDGVADLIASARRYDRDQTRVNAGAAYLLHGRTGLLDPGAGPRGIDLRVGTNRPVDPGFDAVEPVDHLPAGIDAVIVGASRDDHAGFSLAAGDIEGDGGSEVLLGAIGDLARTPGFPGEAYLLSFTDEDGDGASNLIDVDGDNDGLGDEQEVSGSLTQGRPTDPADPDTDGDGIDDGTELGLTCAAEGGSVPCDDPNSPFTSTEASLAMHFRPDADPAFTTHPLDRDSDDDGLSDEEEDADGNGAAAAGETNAGDSDTEGDGVQDGTEMGRTAPIGAAPPIAGTDPNAFVPDADAGATTTLPLDADTDDDGLTDGAEDADPDGAIGGDGPPYGVWSSPEIWTETDPNAPDSDRDGLRDGLEVGAGTSPLDQDSDDDGIPDGLIAGVYGADPNGMFQAREGEDRDLDGMFGPSDGESDPTMPDSDGDGLLDGREAGVPPGRGVAGPNGDFDAGPEEDGTDPNSPAFVPDEDLAGQTEPWDADTDNDGLPDGYIDGYNPSGDEMDPNVGVGVPSVYEGEDLDLNGRLDPGETDPARFDTDDDDVFDGVERGVTAPGVLGPDGVVDPITGGVQDGTGGAGPRFDADDTTLTNPLDRDSDDDGLSDGEEDADSDGLGDPAETDATRYDTDGDVLPDGLERGRTAGVGMDTVEAPPHFIADADPNTTTDPTRIDTDRGGATDGEEDADPNGAVNGHVDTGERDPNLRGDDDRSGDLLVTDPNGMQVDFFPAEMPLYLRLDADTDEDLDPNVIETVTVVCGSSFPDAGKVVTLSALAPSGGVFAGSIPTNTTDPNLPGELAVTPGGTVRCVYTDDEDSVDTRPAQAGVLPPAVLPEMDVEVAASGALSWTPAGGPAPPGPMTYNLYGGDLGVLGATGVYTQAAIACGLDEPAYRGSGTPASGAGSFYLATSSSDGQEGPLGLDSAGRPRPFALRCAP